MATKRSLRVTRQPVKYSQDSSSDEEEDPNIKKAKIKLKKMMDEDSDVESDFEKEMDKNKVVAMDEESEGSSDSGHEELDIKNIIEGGTSKDTDVKNKSAKNNVKGGLSKNVDVKNSKISGGLNLSESDSSSDDDNIFDVPKLCNGNDVKSVHQSPYFMGAKEENEDNAASQTLLALAGNLEKIKDVWKESSVKETPKQKQKMRGKSKSANTPKTKKEAKKANPVTPISSKTNSTTHETSISKLLAAGEGVEYSEEDEEEEEEPEKYAIPTEGVQVTIDLPEHQRRKKKKKGFDVAAFLKREMAKARREIQVLLHKSHFVCLVAHLQHLHLTLSSPLLLATALSMVPAPHCHTPKQLTLTRLSSLLAWFRETVPVNRHRQQVREKVSVNTALMRGMESFLVMNDMELVLVFVLICRSLNYEVRLVLNFPIIPLKPPASQEASESSQVNKVMESTSKETEKNTSTGSKEKDSSKKTEKGGRSSKKSGKESSSSKKSESKKSLKKTQRLKASDSEGEEPGPPPVKLSSKKKTGNTSLSSKLAEAVRRKSSKASSFSESKDTEEDMIKKINKKYPTSKAVEEEPSPSKSKGEKSNKSKKSSSSPKSGERDYWCEIWLAKESKWVSLDLLTGRINAPAEFEGKASKPLTYVLAINRDGSLKDVTQRYAPSFLVNTRKLRHDQSWVDEVLGLYPPSNKEQVEREDLALSRQAGEAPLPTSVSAFKGHPLYVLQRHLLKFEAIYPPNAPTLGFIKSEGVYARECVRTLQGRTSWLKEGRVVKLGEEPYKVVKARPKWDRMTGAKVTDQPLEVFGEWQTEQYIPPPARDGKVPRNEYGNVELFKPWMLPAGTTHIPINGMARVIRKSGIDAAPAMVGWDFSGGGVHPVYDGYVVCEENADALMDAWNQEEQQKEVREREKREKRVLDNWKRLVKSLMFKKKFEDKYLKEK